MSDAPNRRTRTGGRVARIASRLNPGAEVPNPAPTGPVGGQYRPLNESQCRQITDAAFTLLATVGIGAVPEIVKNLARKRGCEIDPDGRLLYTRSFIEDIIARTPKTLQFFGQDPRHDFEVKEQAVRFGTGGAAVQTLDLNIEERIGTDVVSS